MAAKTRDAEATRAGILDAARTQFGTLGFERATIRSIASAAGVDPALVMHYFGNKAQLFAAASHLEIAFPDLTGVAPERVADLVLPIFAKVWSADGPFLTLLRSAATNRAAAEALLKVFVEQVAPAFAVVAPDRAQERAAMVGSQMLGLVVARNIVGVPPLADMDVATLTDWLRPVLAHYLGGAVPD